MRPSARPDSTRVRSAGGVEPVSSACVMPAASSSLASAVSYWRASNSVGAIIAAWRPLPAAQASAQAATTVLPHPTSPISMRFMMRGAAMSATISSTAAFWSSVSSKGKASSRRASCKASPSWAMGCACAHSASRRRIISSWRKKASSKASRRRAVSRAAALGGKWMSRKAALRFSNLKARRMRAGSGS